MALGDRECLKATTDFFFILVLAILVFKKLFHKKEALYVPLLYSEKKVEHVLRLNIRPHPGSQGVV